MGQSKSKQITEAVNEIYNESVTNIISNTTNKTSFDMSVVQNASITVGGTVICTNECTLVQPCELINMTQSGIATVISQVSDDQVNDLKALFENDVDTESTSFQDIMNEMGGLYGVNVDTESQNTIKNVIRNVITTNVTTNKINELIQSFDFNQNGEWKVLPGAYYEGPCGLRMDQTIQVYATSIISNLVKNVIDNSATNEVVNKLENIQQVKNTGYASIIDSLGDLALKAGLGLMMPLIVIGGVFGVGTISMLIKPLKIIGIIFIVSAILGGIVFAIAYTQKIGPYAETPPENVKDECHDLWWQMKEIEKQVEDTGGDEEAIQDIYKEKETTITGYQSCQGIELDENGNIIDSFDGGLAHWTNYKNKMRGIY